MFELMKYFWCYTEWVGSQAVFNAYCFGFWRCPTQPGHADLQYHFKLLQAESII